MLGICRLGHFVASQTGLALDRVNVFVGCEKLGDLSKSNTDLAIVLAAAREELSRPSPMPVPTHTRVAKVRR